jgi:hypothetical protein
VSDYTHDKGRDCRRTDEVLENYKRRAIEAEREVERLKREGTPGVNSEDGAFWTAFLKGLRHEVDYRLTDAERARALVQPTMAAIRSHLHDESIPYKTVLDVLAANEAATLDAERARENDDG